MPIRSSRRFPVQCTKGYNGGLTTGGRSPRACDVVRGSLSTPMASTDADTEEEMMMKAMMMKEWRRALFYGMLMWGFTAFLGCVFTEPLPSTPVSISEFKSVATTWTGMLSETNPSQEIDWMTLTIHDDGSYDYMSERGIIGLFLGKGTFTLIEGKLRAETGLGWAIVTLYEEDGRRMLKVEGAKNLVTYSADLFPTE